MYRKLYHKLVRLETVQNLAPLLGAWIEWLNLVCHKGPQARLGLFLKGFAQVGDEEFGESAELRAKDKRNW